MKNAKLVIENGTPQYLEIYDFDKFIKEDCQTHFYNVLACKQESYWFNSKGEKVLQNTGLSSHYIIENDNYPDDVYFLVKESIDKYLLWDIVKKGKEDYSITIKEIILGKMPKKKIKSLIKTDKKTGKKYYHDYPYRDMDFKIIEGIEKYETRNLILFPEVKQIFLEEKDICFWFNPEIEVTKNIIKGRKPIKTVFADNHGDEFTTGLMNLNPDENSFYSFSNLFNIEEKDIKKEKFDYYEAVVSQCLEEYDFSGMEIDKDKFLKENDVYPYTLITYSEKEPNAIMLSFSESDYDIDTIIFFEGFDFSRLKFKQERNCNLIYKIEDFNRTDAARIRTYERYLKQFNYRKK